MPHIFTSKTQKTGELGESIACIYLKNKGFIIIEQNYTHKVGEIDIVAQKNSILHFIEVKSIIAVDENGVSREINIRPEENMNYQKYCKLQKTVQIYLAHKNVSHETEYQIDLLAIYLDQHKKEAKIKVFEKICF